jgi:hypothetical protein
VLGDAPWWLLSLVSFGLAWLPLRARSSAAVGGATSSASTPAADSENEFNPLEMIEQFRRKAHARLTRPGIKNE